MSDLRRAVQQEIDAHRPSAIPPFAKVVDRKRSRDRRNLAAAATLLVAAIAVAAGAVLLPSRGDDDAVPADPTPTPPTASATATATEEAVAKLPDRYVASTTSELITAGTDGGDPRTLATYNNNQEAAGSYLLDVELSPDGSTVYADVCCEPAAGRTEIIRVNRPLEEPDTLTASGVAASPDGTVLAGIGLEWLVLFEVDASNAPTKTLASENEAQYVMRGSLTWSRDGKLLAMTETPIGDDGPDPKTPSRIRVLDPATATSLEDGQVFEPPAGQTYAAPVFRRDGGLVVARQDADPKSKRPATAVVLEPSDGTVLVEFPLDGRVFDQDYDRTGTYLLTTYSDGRVGWIGAGSRGILVRSGKIRAAAW